MAEEARSPRYRISVSRSVKGVYTWDCTAECDDPDKALEQSDQLVDELTKRYPAPMTEGG